VDVTAEDHIHVQFAGEVVVARAEVREDDGVIEAVAVLGDLGAHLGERVTRGGDGSSNVRSAAIGFRESVAGSVTPTNPIVVTSRTSREGAA